MLVEVVVLQILREHHLAEDVGVQIHGHLVGQQLLAQRLVAAADPADAHTGRDDLGERAEHAALLAQIVAEGVSAVAGEAQLAVRIVLNDQNVRLFEDLGGLFADFGRIGQAGGVLEAGDDIHELRAVRCERLLQLLAVDAVGAQLHGEHGGVIEMEGLQRGQIGRILHDDLVAGVEHHGGEHVQRLLGAVGDDDIVGLHVVHAHLRVALGDELAQRGVALGGAVLQGSGAVLLQHLLHGDLHFLYGEGDGVGQTAAKRNEIGRSSGLQNDSRELSLKIRFVDTIRKLKLHRQFLLFQMRVRLC